jgi:hypothetical protein
MMAKNAGGGESARYCYSVWMRHLVLVHGCGAGQVPAAVAELGPGDSLGTGLAALLCGAERYYGLDVVPHGELARNHALLEELAGLVGARANIPGPDEFPDVKPQLDSYEFPSRILGDDILDRSLAPDRVQRIRDSLRDVEGAGSMIRYAVPWTDASTVEASAVEMVYSQAVLEHVDELPQVYGVMAAWLKPGGVMSHEIDFSAHQFDDRWNGHYTWSDFKWRLLRGGRPYLINRESLSTHLELIEQNGLDVRTVRKVQKESAISRNDLTRRFRDLSDDDLMTRAAYIVASK